VLVIDDDSDFIAECTPSTVNVVTVDANNKFINFAAVTSGDIAGWSGELTATLTEGEGISITTLAEDVETKMEAAFAAGLVGGSGLDFEVSVDPVTQLITIGAADTETRLSSLDLLWATGTNSADSAADILGFDPSLDLGGAAEYTGISAPGISYQVCTATISRSDNYFTDPDPDILAIDIPYIPPDAEDVEFCTANASCGPNGDDAMAGIRYVLNTLLNIKYQLVSREYVRAAPIVDFPYVYQGSFEYPNYEGHFRRYTVTNADNNAGNTGNTAWNWDTGMDYDGSNTRMIGSPEVTGTNMRKVYTSNAGNATIEFKYTGIEDM